MSTSKLPDKLRLVNRTPDLTSSSKKRPASPVSISEAAHLTGPQGSRKKRNCAFERTSSSLAEGPPPVQDWSRSRPWLSQISNPASPSVDNGDQGNDRSARARRSRGTNDYESRAHQPSTPKPGQANRTCPQILSPKSEVPGNGSFQDGGSIEPYSDHLEKSEDRSIWQGEKTRDTTTTHEMGNSNTGLSTPQPLEIRARPRPSVLDTTAGQDISLPSPSLSPVTAAANLQNRRGYFEDPNLGETTSRTAFELSNRSSHEHTDLQSFEPDTQDSHPLMVDSQVSEQTHLNNQLPTPSLMSIPTMVDSFEAMPEEMKTYVMYQMLRRCSKPVLHFVADVVNPALKCDFLSLLPLELCLNIISHLDVKTLCRAAQVSKKWRQVIDSDEKAWKHLFDVDGYILPEGELQRAIREGWGWQHASRPDDWEKDLGVSGIVASDTELSATSAHAGSAGINTLAAPASGLGTHSRRPKRKVALKSKTRSRKQQKRAEATASTAFSADSEAWMEASVVEGPYAAANAAALAVPYPRVGLPRLKNLHLFKSLYQRHHIIRKSWMQDETKPRHIAFRAHQRHVVTCLQFDTDKILTGSDDTNINVYDTQTGALRARLEGHEGGVWALQYEGNVLVSGSTDRSVRVWNIEKGVCTQVFQGHTSTVRCLQILMPTPIKTADGKTTMMPKQPLIITGSRDSNLRVWKLPKPDDKTYFQAGPAPDDAECPYFVRVLTGHHHSVRAIAAYADTLVSGSYDCSVRVWKISTGETVHRLQGHTQKVYSVVLDHKRNRCISGSMDNLVKVWSLDTGLVLFNLEGHSSLVGLLDLQQDRLVSAAADSTLRIWDPENGHCKSILTAHTGAITCFQHDGQKVISGSDRTLKMWNVTTGEFVKDLLTDLSGVWQVKFNERRCVAAVQRKNLTYIEVNLRSRVAGSKF